MIFGQLLNTPAWLDCSKPFVANHRVSDLREAGLGPLCEPVKFEHLRLCRLLDVVLDLQAHVVTPSLLAALETPTLFLAQEAAHVEEERRVRLL